MARIETFQPGIEREAPQVTPQRAPDFGPGIGAGFERLGQSLGEAAQKVNEIQDLDARIEANKIAIAHSKLQASYDQTVRTTLGDAAPAAADKATRDLNSETAKLLAGASPRARRILEPELTERNTNASHEWGMYGFEQNKQAYDTSTQAANDGDLEAASRTDTDAAAKPFLDSIAARNAERGRFFGLPSDWVTQENTKAVSSFYKSRALKIGLGSASAAISYAIKHRDQLSDADFDAIQRSYRDESLDEQAEVEADRYDGGITTKPEPLTTTENTPEGEAKRADPKLVFNSLEMPNEGSKAVIDSNGAVVKYGINQADNPDVDVPNLTRAGAEKLFVNRVWNKSGADKLPPALAVVHADTFFLNEKEATKILHASGGDVNKYMQMRETFLAELHAKDPKKYPDYTSRNQRVEAMAAQVGGDGSARVPLGQKITAETSLAPIEAEIDARPDMPLALKTRIKRVLRERRAALVEDKHLTEDNARDDLLDTVTKLGDGFTSTKQLPQDRWLAASAETRNSLTRIARNNNYKKNDEKLLPEVTYTEFTDPKRFMSKDYLIELGRQGASPQLITHVATKQAELLQKQMSAKPSVITDGSLWSMAKPAFAAAGLAIDTKNTGGKQAAASQQVQATNFLQNLATTWEQQNPGQKATPEIMRQWIGSALLQVGNKRLFQASDADLYNSLSPAIRGTIVRGLRRHGFHGNGPDLVAHVASAYRQLRALYGTGPIQFRPDDSVNAAPLQGTQVGQGIPNMEGPTAIDMSDADYGDDQ